MKDVYLCKYWNTDERNLNTEYEKIFQNNVSEQLKEEKLQPQAIPLCDPLSSWQSISMDCK